MKYLRLFEDNEFSIGDTVNVNSNLIKGEVGKIVKIDGKLVTLNMGGKNHIVSINHISPNNDIDPFDEEDWDEDDQTKIEINDVIATHIEDKTVTLDLRDLANNRWVDVDDINLNENEISFYMYDDFNQFNPQSLVNLEQYLYGSQFVDNVRFKIGGQIIIELDIDYEYEEG